MKTIAKILVMFVVAVLIVSGAFLLGYAASQQVLARTETPVQQTASNAPVAGSMNDGAPADFKEDMAVFWEAWRLINDNFYRQPLDPGEMTYGAISGMVDSLGDEHTAFVNPERAAYLQTQLSGSFEGIGATVEMVNGRLTIIAPIKGTPAEKAGLQAGDVILQVDDTLIQNMDVMEAISIIRGPKGTDVRLKVQRGTEPAFDLTITRNTITVPEVEAKMLEDDTIAYIQLTEFGDKAPTELRKALQETLAKNPKALIFDLRSNPGGYLHTAIEVASEFIDSGQVVLVEKFKSGQKKTYEAQAGGLATKVPMVLLVNEGSASASEILAASLRDHKRALIVGQTTFGKGSVQTTHNLSDQSQLRVTIANFYSPNETEINDVGVVPDVEVPDPTEYERSRGIDPQLQKAIELIKAGEITPPQESGSTSMAQPAPVGEMGLLEDLKTWIAINWFTPRLPA
jgi:carboxyl-terminal processing protease